MPSQLTCTLPRRFALVLVLNSAGLVFSGEWTACKGRTGTCIDTYQNKYSCSGASTVYGICNGDRYIRCCPSPGGVRTTQCTNKGGVCMLQSSCGSGRRTASDICPGPSSIKCCYPGASNPVNTPKKSDGAFCSSNTQCTSGVCRGSNCCGYKGRSTGCTDCSYSGVCSSCSSGYSLNNGQCVGSCCVYVCAAWV